MARPDPHVIFGTHPLFGDYVDAIHAVGGILTRLVRNMEEPERPPGERVEDRIANYEKWLERRGISHRVEVVWLDKFEAREEEKAVAGFRGPKLAPMVRGLKESYGVAFDPLVHPSAYVSPMAELAEGVFIGAGSVVGPNARIGAFSYLNRGVTIGHDVEMEEHVIVGPSVSVGSRVRMCCGCILGIGATVLEEVMIGEGGYVAGGAVVLRDVGAHRMVAGVPAVDKKAFYRK